MLTIRPYAKADEARALEICVAAFRPVHQGFREQLGEAVFRLQYHDWEDGYARIFAAIAEDDPVTEVFVGEADGRIVGFVFASLDAERKTGEIGLNAVDPDCQGRGYGKALYAFALAHLKGRGAEIGYVATGLDAAHAPARAAYEAMGFDRRLPTVHYFREL